MTHLPATALLEGAEPFSHDGDGVTGRIGVVLSHGFTGTPASMRPWAQHLAAQGYSVRLPRLPGHGTRWQDMNSTRWTDWYGEVRASYDELAGRCDTMFAAGLSMGGTLVTKLAADVGTDLTGLVLVNAAFGTMRRDARFARFVAPFVASRPGIGSDIKKPVAESEPGYDRTPLRGFVQLQKLWKVVVPELHKVRAPVLYYHSTVDHVVDELSGRLLHAGAVNTEVTEVPLADSYHVATMDNDAEKIFAGSVDFIRSLTAHHDEQTSGRTADGYEREGSR